MFRSVALTLALATTGLSQQAEEQARKILADNCLGCHGPARISGLSLSTREGILAGGKRGPAIVPGKASESLLYEAINHAGGLSMPPGNKALTREQIAVIGSWIDAGAPFSNRAAETAWWSFVKPVRPTAQSINDLIRPDKPAADRLTLIRRAFPQLRKK